MSSNCSIRNQVGAIRQHYNPTEMNPPSFLTQRKMPCSLVSVVRIGQEPLQPEFSDIRGGTK